MNRFDWIVCERTSRWAAALRMALARDAQAVDRTIYEVRSLQELSSRLDARPKSVAVLEITRDQLGNVLTWLTAATREFPSAQFVGAFDATLIVDECPSVLSESQQQDVINALFEAGANEIANSPRRLHAVLALGRCHAKRSAERSERVRQTNHSVIATAWASLPWQDR